jgi:hypothetical protein
MHGCGCCDCYSNERMIMKQNGICGKRACPGVEFCHDGSCPDASSSNDYERGFKAGFESGFESARAVEGKTTRPVKHPLDGLIDCMCPSDVGACNSATCPRAFARKYFLEGGRDFYPDEHHPR